MNYQRLAKKVAKKALKLNVSRVICQDKNIPKGSDGYAYANLSGTEDPLVIRKSFGTTYPTKLCDMIKEEYQKLQESN
jgi:hypothetical protein